MTSLLPTHKRNGTKASPTTVGKANAVYAYPTNRWRGTATSRREATPDVNPISGLGSYNTALCGFAVASGNLSNCCDLSFAGETT